MDEIDHELTMVTERLRVALGDAGGKLRAADALTLAGFASPSYRRQQLVAQALRSMGWERGRFRHHGKMLYVYVRGAPLEREAMLYIERSEDGFIMKKREP